MDLIVIMPKKYLSGFEKRKKKQRIDNLIQSQEGVLDKFFCNKKQSESSSLVEDVESEEQIDLGNEEQEDRLQLLLEKEVFQS